MWKVNCCKKRHRIVFTPRGRLLFLDHPTYAHWRQVETLEALHRQNNTGYACRCYQIKSEWKKFLSTNTYTAHADNNRKKFLGNLSRLPNGEGVTLHSQVPRLERELNSCTSVKEMETLLSLCKVEHPETKTPLVETKWGMTMRHIAWELILFHCCRAEMKERQHRRWYQDAVLEVCEANKRRRPRIVLDRKNSRMAVFNKLDLSSNLFLERSSLSSAKFEGLTFVSANPRHTQTHLEDNKLSIEAVFLQRVFDRWGRPTDVQMIWVWAHYEPNTKLWYLENKNSGKLHWEKEK